MGFNCAFTLHFLSKAEQPFHVFGLWDRNLAEVHVQVSSPVSIGLSFSYWLMEFVYKVLHIFRTCNRYFSILNGDF